MRIQRVLAAAALFVAGIFSAAGATPITYELAGLFSGSVGTTSVSDTLFDWTITADTSAVFAPSPGILALPAITSTIDITGIGAVTPTDPTFALFAPAIEAGGFGNASTTMGVEFFSPYLTGYNGLSPVGPVLAFLNPVTPITTDHGDWIVTGMTLPFGFFQVTGGDIPEPATLALFGAGLAGLGAARRNRKTRS